MKTIVPPIKSQGIKTKLVPWINSRLPSSQGRWIEPFFGTGVVGFNSGFKKALLGDCNPHLIRFYQAVKEGMITPTSAREYLTKEGACLSSADDNGSSHYRFIRDRFNEKSDPLDFLFLSRAGFNGMMRFNSKGKWNIPFCKKPERFSPSYITKIVNQIREVQTVITPDWTFLCSGFEALISEAQTDDIIYCDPPYIGRHVDYYVGWTEDNERKLYEMLSETPAKFILSTWHHNAYRKNEFIDKMWGNFNVVTKSHFYHSGARIENRRPIVEALITNF